MEKNKIKYKELIVIGGSSGSLQVIIHILGQLPPDYPIAILLIMHRGNTTDSMLLELLVLKSILRVKEVEEKEKIMPSIVYLAPADYHVLIEDDKTFSLDYSEKLNFSRPSIDVTFTVAAEVYGNQLTGILLSGGNEDGAEGLKKINESGGFTIIQDPEDAAVNYMPRQAGMRTKIDAVLDTRGITNYLLSFVTD